MVLTSDKLDLINDTFDRLIDLKQLSSVDATIRRVMANPWDDPILTRLEIRHPKLRKVFLSYDRITCVWVLGREGLDIWERHDLFLVTSWDIVTGRYDYI